MWSRNWSLQPGSQLRDLVVNQESPRQTKPKKGQFMNFSRGHSGTKVQCESCLFSQGKTPESTKMGEIHELFVLALSLVWFAGATSELSSAILASLSCNKLTCRALSKVSRCCSATVRVASNMSDAYHSTSEITFSGFVLGEFKFVKNLATIWALLRPTFLSAKDFRVFVLCDLVKLTNNWLKLTEID